VASLTLFGFVLAAYVSMTLLWHESNLFFGADSPIFTQYTLTGENFPLAIWPSVGRFIPLALQEFNLIRHFSHTAAGYAVVPIVELIVLAYLLVLLNSDVGIAVSAGIAAVTLLSPAIAFALTNLVYSERHLLLTVAGLAFSVQRFERTRSRIYAVSAVVCAQIMLYHKEIAFLLLFAFVAVRLTLRSRNGDCPWGGGVSRWLRDKDTLLDLVLAALSVLFALYYLKVMIHGSLSYDQSGWLPPLRVALLDGRNDVLAVLFIVVLLCRWYLLWQRRVAVSLLWDGLACGGLVYFVSLIILGRYREYYLAPVDLIAGLYLSRLAVLAWRRLGVSYKFGAAMLLILILLQNTFFLLFDLYERKNIFHAKAQIASLINTRSQSMGSGPQRLLFPFSDSYLIAELGDYLDYRGLGVEGARHSSAAGRNKVLLISKRIDRDGACGYYRDLLCHVGKPQSGDLIVQLPDDNVPRANALEYTNRGHVLLSYEPYPTMPGWLYGFIERLRHNERTTDGWLHAWVAVWR
jgi:hypothetical protein